MDENENDGSSQQKVIINDDANIVRSPAAELVKNIKVPEMSVPEFYLQAIDLNYELVKNKVLVADVVKGTSYKFSEIKPLTRKIASALTRHGFEKGDVLYYVTYDAALIYIVHLGVWLCGGATRGCFQRERKEVYETQMREVHTRFIICDPETSVSVKWAAEKLEWPVTILSIGGEVEGALSVEEMVQNEDCSAFPNDVKINPREDPVVVVNTSGSTGAPKGVMHTHFDHLAYFVKLGLPKKMEKEIDTSMLAVVGNFLTAGYGLFATSIVLGSTYYTVPKFNQNTFMMDILKYKPQSLFLHPYAANEFAQSPEVEMHDLSFIQYILSGGSVFSMTTAKMIEDKLPHTKLHLTYGTTEAHIVATTTIDQSLMITKPDEGEVAGIKFKILQGEPHLSSGRLLPYVEAKIVDPLQGYSVNRNVIGNLVVRTQHFMKGYINNKEKESISTVLNKDGWYDTGDIAFFDDDGYLYVVDRNKFTFKYCMNWVSPAEVEGIILEHPAVVTAVVVGVPDPKTTSVARAYVVLKPGSKVTEEEIISHVAVRTDKYKQLHGGVTVIDSVPVTPGGKLDRLKLQKLAISELASRNNTSS